MDSGNSSDQHGWRKGPWTPEEDKLLCDYIRLHGDGRWTSVAMFSGLKRNGKSCRLRWVNYLRPGLKKGNLTPQEEGVIIELHAIWGNKWSTIARYLPGRTDNEIKNYWRTHFNIKSKPSQRHERRKTEALRHKKHHQTPENNEQNNCASANNNINQEMVFPYNANVIVSHHPSPITNYHDDHGTSWSETIIGDDLWGSLWNLDDQHYRAVDQNSSSAYSFGAATGAAI